MRRSAVYFGLFNAALARQRPVAFLCGCSSCTPRRLLVQASFHSSPQRWLTDRVDPQLNKKQTVWYAKGKPIPPTEQENLPPNMVSLPEPMCKLESPLPPMSHVLRRCYANVFLRPIRTSVFNYALICLLASGAGESQELLPDDAHSLAPPIDSKLDTFVTFAASMFLFSFFFLLNHLYLYLSLDIELWTSTQIPVKGYED